MELATICEKLKEKFASQILDQIEFRGEYSLCVTPEALLAVCTAAKNQFGFDSLADISSVDHLGKDPRFEVVYELYSMQEHLHLRIKTQVAEDAAEVDTVSTLWATADWHEREIWDLMGIRFRNHPDLRRILMWEGYPYHPLRKDFPLAGLPSDMPDVAFTGEAPLAGGPFVTAPTTGNTQVREPRARSVENLPPASQFIAEP